MVLRGQAMRVAVLLLLSVALVSCGLVVSFSGYDDAIPAPMAPLYAVRGTVDGLGPGIQVTVLLNGASSSLVADGSFEFPPALADGDGFVVSAIDPPGHPCTLTNGTGTIAGADVAGVAIHCPISSDATLSNLSTSAGGLQPTFAASLDTYAAGPILGAAFYPPWSTTTVTATAREPGSKIVIAGVTTASGQPSAPIEIQPGSNTIKIVVTAADEKATKQYTLAISGAPTSDYIKPSNTHGEMKFGGAVAMSGDTLVVGAAVEASGATGVNGDQSDRSAPGAGAVYVYTRTGGVWSQQAYLKASNAGPGAYFGTSVALSGDRLVVGAPGEASAARGVNGDQTDTSLGAAGAVYVFARAGGTWVQEAYIKASNPRGIARFGFSVALAGKTLLVGSPLESSDAKGVNQDQNNTNATMSGAAYVFARTSAGWSQTAYIKASNTRSGALFGTSVAIAGTMLAVGSPDESSEAKGVNGDEDPSITSLAGAVYVFTQTGAKWSQDAYIKASNTDGGQFFGTSVALSGDTLAVGAEGEQGISSGVNKSQASDPDMLYAGAVYVFTRRASMWSQQAYIKASNSRKGTRLGTSIALSGDTLAVGAQGDSSIATGVNGDESSRAARGSGAAYVFTRSGSVWSQRAYVKASNTRASAFLGMSIAVSGGEVAVGSYGESSAATGVNGDQQDTSLGSAGAVYVVR